MENDSTRNEGTLFIPEKGFYQPSTEDTREAYQALFSIIEQQLGARSEYLMYVAAEEILSVLKSDFFEYPFERKNEIDKILRPLPFHIFDQLVSIGEVITDYNQVVAKAEQGFYQPRTEETWTAYKKLIDLLEQMIGHQPLIDQCMIAHEVLLILKDQSTCDNKKKKKKKWRIEKRLGYKMHYYTFERLIEIARQIWDFDEFRRVKVERKVSGYHEEGIGPSWGVQGGGIFNWESDEEMDGVKADGGGYWGDAWDKGVKAGGVWSSQFAVEMTDEVKKGAIYGGGDGWGNEVNAGWSMQVVNSSDGINGWGEYGGSSSHVPIDGQDEVDESKEVEVNGGGPGDGGLDLSVLKLDCELSDQMLLDDILGMSIRKLEADSSDPAAEQSHDLDMSVLKLDDDKDENDQRGPMQNDAEKDGADDWVKVDFDGTN